MTICELLTLIRRNLKFVVTLPTALLVIVIIWSVFTQTSYTATASFVTSGDLALAQGLANKQAASRSNADIRISCSSSTTAKQISVSATGSDSSACIAAANAAVDETVKQYKEMNSNIIAVVNETNYATQNGSSIIKNAFMALAAGLFFAVCVLLVINSIKNPVKSQREIEEVSNLPVLGEAPSSEGGERLLANLQFSNDGKPSTVAVVPVGVAETALLVARELAAAFEHSDIRVKLVKGSPHARKFKVSVPENAAIIVSCESFDMGMGAAYIAHNADATVVCVAEWVDSKKQFLSTVRELNFAKANIAGVVIIPEQKTPRKPQGEKQS